MKYVSSPTPEKLCTDYKPFLQNLFKRKVLCYYSAMLFVLKWQKWNGGDSEMKLSGSSVRKTISLCMPSKSLCISHYHYAALLIILFIQSQSATLSLSSNQSLVVEFKSALSLSLLSFSPKKFLRSPPPPLLKKLAIFNQASSEVLPHEASSPFSTTSVKAPGKFSFHRKHPNHQAAS